mmetsp:Transcript_19650/g.27266  ORF Transcript_19650/g.27266 Transcript_19650/m.27266 type:complete len:167 (-) Transcript_19650:928-1428(-)
MDKILEMATKAGMDQKQAETSSGGILSFLKGKLGDEQFSKIAEKVPGAGEAAQKYDDESSSASSGGGGMGGMLGGAMSSITKSSGGGSDAGGVAGLTAMLASKGVDAGQLSKFLPQISSFLKDKAGVDVTSALGLPSDGGSSTSGGGNPADSAKKMFGGFGKMFGK